MPVYLDSHSRRLSFAFCPSEQVSSFLALRCVSLPSKLAWNMRASLRVYVLFLWMWNSSHARVTTTISRSTWETGVVHLLTRFSPASQRIRGGGRVRGGMSIECAWVAVASFLINMTSMCYIDRRLVVHVGREGAIYSSHGHSHRGNVIAGSFDWRSSCHMSEWFLIFTMMCIFRHIDIARRLGPAC